MWFLVSYIGFVILVITANYFSDRRSAKALPREPQEPQPLWLEFESCHVDLERDTVSAEGILDYAGSDPEKFMRDFRPFFEIRISANRKTIDMMVYNLEFTHGSTRVQWRAQDKESFISQHTQP